MSDRPAPHLARAGEMRNQASSAKGKGAREIKTLFAKFLMLFQLNKLNFSKFFYQEDTKMFQFSPNRYQIRVGSKPKPGIISLKHIEYYNSPDEFRGT